MKDFRLKIKPDELEEVSPGELAAEMSDLAAMGVTLDKIKEVLAATDQAALKTQALNRVKVKVWEEGDLVNGINLREHPNPTLREQMMRNVDAGGNIYLVFIDNKLTYNQWHIKDEGLAPVTNDRLQEVVDGHIKNIAQHLFTEALRREVLKKL